MSVAISDLCCLALPGLEKTLHKKKKFANLERIHKIFYNFGFFISGRLCSSVNVYFFFYRNLCSVNTKTEKTAIKIAAAESISLRFRQLYMFNSINRAKAHEMRKVCDS